MRVMEQVIVDKVTREAVRHFGDRPHKDGLSWTVDANGTKWAWFRKSW